MIEGRPSATAQRVACYRLGFDRISAPYGDPEADLRLTRSVADGLEFEPSAGMLRYLRHRTSFFDRVVVNAVDRGVTQLVCIGAGYDGRALRYGHPSVRWFEVDHPSTSADKQARLRHLEIDARAVTFVGWDLADPGLGAVLTAAGFDPDGPTQFLLEGVVVYLPPSVRDSLLREIRALCSPGSRLALSLSVGAATTERRARFGDAVKALGEPVQSEPLSPDGAAELFGSTGWTAVELSAPSAQAGLTVLRPTWTRAEDPTTASVIGRFMERVMHRTPDGLADHVAAAYGKTPSKLRELDLGVFRVDFGEGPSWVARLGPPGHGLASAEANACLLRSLDAVDFPAERPAAEPPVTDWAARRSW